MVATTIRERFEMRRTSITASLLVSMLLSAMGIQAASAQLLEPGQTIRAKLERTSPTYPNTVSNLQPNGLQYVCHAIDTTPGSHWQIEVKASAGNFLAIGRGANCIEARAAGWLHTALKSEGLWNPTTTLRVTAGGGRYVVAVTSHYYGGYKIRALETAGGADYVVLARGRRPEKEPPAGTASTIKGAAQIDVAPGRTIRDCETCPEMVALPTGSYMMGSDELEEGREASEGPRHRVKIERPFAIGRFEVTFDEYDACVADGGCDRVLSDNGWGRARRPVINVSYVQARRYVSWLSETTGHAYFIPSEAEWEYAARAGSETPWNTGTAIITGDANFLQTFGKTVAAGSYPPNAFGLHDMHGNVWEWSQDCLDAGYLGVPENGAAAVSGDCLSKRIARGGAHTSSHAQVRSAMRGVFPEHTQVSTVGFRVARAL